MTSPEFSSKEQRKQEVIDNLSLIMDRVPVQYESSKNELRALSRGWDGDPRLQAVYDEFYAEAGFTTEDFDDLVKRLDALDGGTSDDEDWGESEEAE